VRKQLTTPSQACTNGNTGKIDVKNRCNGRKGNHNIITKKSDIGSANMSINIPKLLSCSSRIQTPSAVANVLSMIFPTSESLKRWKQRL
jgi:hypothetical protein